MTPTNKLRWAKRIEMMPQYGEGIGKEIHVLQQWWEKPFQGVYVSEGGIKQLGGNGEWRDVPVEEE